MWRSFPGHGDWWTCCHPVGFPWWSCSAWDDIYRWGRPLSNCWHGWLWLSSLTALNTASTEERQRQSHTLLFFVYSILYTWLHHNQQLIQWLIDWSIIDWLIDWIGFFLQYWQYFSHITAAYYTYIIAMRQYNSIWKWKMWNGAFLIITNWF